MKGKKQYWGPLLSCQELLTAQFGDEREMMARRINENEGTDQERVVRIREEARPVFQIP